MLIPILIIIDESNNEENKSEHSYSIDDEGEASHRHKHSSNRVGFFEIQIEKEEKDNGASTDLFEDLMECKVNASEKSSVFHCNMYPLQFAAVDNGDTQGYAVRLDLYNEGD